MQHEIDIPNMNASDTKGWDRYCCQDEDNNGTTF